MARARQLILEQFEDRTVPATFNVPWPEANSLTISFAPDGTLAGNQSSSLFRTLDAQLPTAVWQQEILRAFQTWAVEANINVGLVADGGQPFGTLGLKQGDPRFGDVRIGAFPMARDVLAVANPYDPFVANTWVGDVFLNSSYPFSMGGPSTSPDLFSVLLHEAGHVFGIGPSTDPNSPLFEQFHLVQNGLTPEDVASLRALYGARPADAFEGPDGNNTFATATPLSLPNAGGQPTPVTLAADVSTLADADVYRLVVPAGVQALAVQLQAAGISLLVPRLTVYDAFGNVINTALATTPLNNDLSLRLDQVTAGDTYYVKVEGGQKDVFGIGSYQLEVQPQLAAADASHSNGGACHYAATISAGNQLSPSLNGVQLLATTPGYVEHTYYEVGDSISMATPAHTYRVLSADIGKDMTNVMTVVVNALESNEAPLQVTVYDNQGNRVDARTMLNQEGQTEVRVPSVRSDQEYDVEVRGSNFCGDQVAHYQVAIDFAQDASHLQTFVNESLGPDEREALRTLQVVESQQFHFVLSATDWSAPVETGVRMTILDGAGRTVFSMAVQDGATRGGDVFLDQGRYTVRFTRANEQGQSLAPVLFELSGTSLSDALGPQLRDTTRQPVEAATVSAMPQPTFFWLLSSPTDLPAGSLRPSPPAALAPADRVGVSVALSSVPATQNLDFRGAPGDPAPETGRMLPLPSQSSASAPSALVLHVASSPNSGQSETRTARAPMESRDLPASGVFAGSSESPPLTSQEPAPLVPELRELDHPLANEGTTLGTRMKAAEVAGDSGCSTDPLSLQVTGPQMHGHAFWAIGLGGLVLSWLLLPDRGLGMVVPTLRRLGPRRER